MKILFSSLLLSVVFCIALSLIDGLELINGEFKSKFFHAHVDKKIPINRALKFNLSKAWAPQPIFFNTGEGKSSVKGCLSSAYMLLVAGNIRTTEFKINTRCGLNRDCVPSPLAAITQHSKKRKKNRCHQNISSQAEV